MSEQKKKLLISSLNLYLMKHLNIFVKSLGFSQVLIRLQVCRTVVCQWEWKCVHVRGMVVFQGELPFSIDVKGGEHVVGRGVMIVGGSTCVAINAKGGDC